MRQISEEELRKPLTDQQTREIRALEDMPDSEIDLSDISEIRELPARALRGLFCRGPMIRLPDELRCYFADLTASRRLPVNDLVVEAPEKALAGAEAVR